MGTAYKASAKHLTRLSHHLALTPKAIKQASKAKKPDYPATPVVRGARHLGALNPCPHDGRYHRQLYWCGANSNLAPKERPFGIDQESLDKIHSDDEREQREAACSSQPRRALPLITVKKQKQTSGTKFSPGSEVVAKPPARLGLGGAPEQPFYVVVTRRKQSHQE
ncbi:hypothetical protein Nepgr_026667 [Nepenthes gracilis]|uniref:Uncharacterized protein n=1 Tax=Nepenthes gracilis TaxID=150966 RepID=A0AAD3Y2B1_NEPGR|nr:hypothetical protein Nepgr_026667 [Nepenthes gracilis]